MSTEPLFHVDIDEGLEAIHRDLVRDGGPQISTLRNHPFAILPYEPKQEFRMRRGIHNLATRLSAGGWHVLWLSLKDALMSIVREQLGDDLDDFYIPGEKTQSRHNLLGGLKGLQGSLSGVIEGEGGLADLIVAAITDARERFPDKTDTMVVFLGQAGALYPFHRNSALLKNLAGRTMGVPVILFYPGTRGPGRTELSFMGLQKGTDRDYRPRIYP